MLAEVLNQINELDPWILFMILFVLFVGTLAIVPLLVIRIPADYFQESGRHRVNQHGRSGLVHLLLIALKNLAGAVLILLGIMMLVLPGQGLLTILIGLLLMNFPGKYRLERWLVSREPVLHSVNWLRSRRNKPALVIDADRQQ